MVLDEGDEISRILPFGYAMSLLEDGEMYFSHPSSWDDPFERLYNEEKNKLLFAQCWCLTGYSDAMWRIFSTNNKKISNEPCVQIRTYTKKLEDELDKIKQKYKINILSNNVNYKNTITIKKLIRDKTKPTEIIFIKRKPFRSEEEYRFVIEANRDNKIISIDKKYAIIKLKSSPTEIFHRMIIDPWASKKLAAALKAYCKSKLGENFSCVQSNIYQTLKT